MKIKIIKLIVEINFKIFKISIIESNSKIEENIKWRDAVRTAVIHLEEKTEIILFKPRDFT